MDFPLATYELTVVGRTFLLLSHDDPYPVNHRAFEDNQKEATIGHHPHVSGV
jgi:hypothetical protein